ncbi:MAG TPA: hypothetical protein DEA08_21330 [Planctomycetes bacterium]|nr:hypothetical protein [Planctomycetota bacterium]
MPSPSQQSAKRTLGPYQLLEELGRGAYGIVYRAQREGGEEVALKVLLKCEGEAVRRFQREAEITSRLQEPGIVRTLDVGQDGRHPYFAMELCPGPTLKDRLREGPLRPSAAAELVGHLARAVAAAHQWAVIHRDLKPGNVILDAKRGPRITDFGLAKDTARERLTHTGDVLGTPVYMAPEQITGRRIDHRIDVYALGVLLYECLCGSVPYYAPDIQQLARMIEAGRPKPLREQRPEIPPELEAICLRAMARDVDERYPTASALADALEEHAPKHLAQTSPAKRTLSEDVSPAPRSPLRVTPLTLVAAGAAALSALGLVASLLYARGQQEAGQAAGREAGRAEARAEVLGELAGQLLAEAERQHQQNVDLTTQERTLARVELLDPSRAPEVARRRELVQRERERRARVEELQQRIVAGNREGKSAELVQRDLNQLEAELREGPLLPEAKALAAKEGELLELRKRLALALNELNALDLQRGTSTLVALLEEIRDLRGSADAIRLEALRGALAWIERELRRFPEGFVLLVWKGFVQLRMGQVEEAVKTWSSIPESREASRYIHELRERGLATREESDALSKVLPWTQWRGPRGRGPWDRRGPWGHDHDD